MRRLPALVLLGSVALLLASCATATATPSVDLDAAQEWLKEVQDGESDGPGAAGYAALQVGPADQEPDDGTEHGIRLDFENPANLTRADARCFGGGTVDVIVTTYTADGTEGDTGEETIVCDEEPHEVPLAAPDATAVLVNGHTDTLTYLHVTIIESLTIER
jgi:hypothetical protein